MSQISLSRRYFWGMASGAGSVVLKTSLNLLLVPMLIAKLGLDVFSLHTLLLTILEIILLLDLGASSALVKLLGNHQAESDRQSYLKIGQGFFTVMALGFLLVSLCITPWFSHIFHLGPALTKIVQIGLPITLLEAAVLLYGIYYEAILMSHCAHQWTNLADAQHTLFTSVGSLVLLMLGADLTAIIILRFVSSFLRLGVIIFHSARLEPVLFRLKAAFDFSKLKEMMRLSVHAFTINLSIIVSHKIDTLIIALFLPISAVGIYDVVFRMFGITVQICLKLCGGSFALFSKMAATQNIADARQFFLRTSSFLYFVAALLVLLIGSYYFELFALFSAGHIPVQKTIPLLWLAIPCILSGILQMPAKNWLFTWGYQSYITRSSVLTAGINLLLSVALTPVLGILGVALGTLVPQLIQHQAGLIRMTCQKLGISFSEYLKSVHLGVILPLFSVWIWVQLGRLCFPPSVISAKSLIPIVLTSGSAMVIGLALWFLLNASAWEKNLVRGFYISRLKPILQSWGLCNQKAEPISL